MTNTFFSCEACATFTGYQKVVFGISCTHICDMVAVGVSSAHEALTVDRMPALQFPSLYTGRLGSSGHLYAAPPSTAVPSLVLSTTK